MSEATTEPVVQTSVDEPTPAAPATDAAPADGETALGDAGKKALDAMKAERKTARDQAAAEKARADALQAKLDGKEAEYAAEQKSEQAAQAEFAAEQKSEQAAQAKFNDRIIKTEVKAAAKGVLADPADAYKFLDLSKFEVDDDGNVDEAVIAKALTDLIEKKPYLAAQGGTRFQGTADGGARNDAAKTSQLSQADLASMTPGEVNKARREGRLDDLLRK
jgi:hypothetical protein